MIYRLLMINEDDKLYMPMYLSHYITENRTFFKILSKKHPHLNHYICILKYIFLCPIIEFLTSQRICTFSRFPK